MARLGKTGLWLTAGALLLVGPAAYGQIFSCKNLETGVTEYQDRPCNQEQTAEAVRRAATEPRKRAPAAAAAAGGGDLTQVMVERDRANFQTVCEDNLDRDGLGDAEYDRRCEAALAATTECKLAMFRSMPDTVYDAYVDATLAGAADDKAFDQAMAPANWGGKSEDEVMMAIMGPMFEFTDCAESVFQ